MHERMHTLARWATIAGVTVALGGAAQAEAPGKSPTAVTKDKPSPACTFDETAKTKMVLEFLHAANASEIKHARYATQTSPSTDVKKLAEHFVADHTDGDKKLVELAQKKGIELTLPASEKAAIDPIHAAVHGMDAKVWKDLTSKSGAAFDAAFLGAEVNEHLLVLSVIEEGQKVAKDTDVKALFDELHKTVSAHRDHAAQLADRLKLTGGKPVGGGPKSEKPDPKAGTGLHHHQDK